MPGFTARLSGLLDHHYSSFYQLQLPTTTTRCIVATHSFLISRLGVRYLSSRSSAWIRDPGRSCSGVAAMAMTRTALVMILFMVGFIVGTEGQVAMAPTPAGLVPGMAPAAGPVFQPTGSPNYISYLALGANRAPCPSGTGRSYYTQNCTEQLTATPYTRSCTEITRCARG